MKLAARYSRKERLGGFGRHTSGAGASRERGRVFHPPLQGEGRAPQVRGVGCAAMLGVAARLRALSPQPAALRAATFPLQGKVRNSAHVAAPRFDNVLAGGEEQRNDREKP